jgi:hypothetical protein
MHHFSELSIGLLISWIRIQNLVITMAVSIWLSKLSLSNT